MARTPTDKPPKSRRRGVLAEELHKREMEVIAEHLRWHSGNVGATAKALGISRRTLETKMAEHSLRGNAADMRADAGITGPRR